MTYKTISVSLNEVSRVEPVLTFASDLAQDQDAHLIGLYVIPAVQVYPDISGAAVPMVIEEYREFFENQSGQVREVFEDITRRMSLRSEWRSVNSASPLISDSTIEHGRESDLIIVSEVGSATETGIEADFVERVWGGSPSFARRYTYRVERFARSGAGSFRCDSAAQKNG